MTTKTCPGVETDDYAQPSHTLELEHFGAVKQRPDGRAGYCKWCAAAKQRQWKRDHPDQVRKWKREAQHASG